MATDSLASVLPRWKDWLTKALSNSVLKAATYPLPNTSPKFLGTIIQKYRPRNAGAPSKAFQKWIDEIQAKVNSTLIPALSSRDMLLPEAAYKSVGLKPGEPLLQMSDFNALIAQSQKYSAPVFELTDVQLEQTGVVLNRTKASMAEFKKLFSSAAEVMITLVDYK